MTKTTTEKHEPIRAHILLCNTLRGSRNVEATNSASQWKYVDTADIRNAIEYSFHNHSQGSDDCTYDITITDETLGDGSMYIHASITVYSGNEKASKEVKLYITKASIDKMALSSGDAFHCLGKMTTYTSKYALRKLLAMGNKDEELEVEEHVVDAKIEAKVESSLKASPKTIENYVEILKSGKRLDTTKYANLVATAKSHGIMKKPYGIEETLALAQEVYSKLK